MQGNVGNCMLSIIILILQLEKQNNLIEDKSKWDDFTKNYKGPRKYFDFIVDKWVNILVGGGAAGCLVASRLSQYFETLLLEAGPEPPALVSEPNYYRLIARDPDINYNFSTIPQMTNGNKRVLTFTNGKMLGGSGSHNAMIWNRGSPKTYDNYAKIIGDRSWKYKYVSKIFKQLEKYRGIYEENDEYGKKGEISIITEKDPTQLFAKVVEEFGGKIFAANGPQKIGYAYMDVTKSFKDHLRESSFTAYIQHKYTPKLTIYKYTTVQKIIFRGTKAIGVIYQKNAKKFRAMVKKEIILSAGTILTPIILSKSGVGPKSVLKKAGIKLVKHIPAVGKNFFDHRKLVIICNFTSDPSHNHNMSWLKVDVARPIFQRFLASEQNKYADTAITVIWHISEDTGEKYLAFEIFVNTRQPGSITLTTDKKLSIDPNYAADSKTVIPLFVQGIKEATKMCESKALKKYGSHVVRDKSCEHIQDNDKYYECLIFRNYDTSNHFTSTCRMGKGKNSVVDKHFKIRGLRNIRIIDGSVLPTVPNTNTAAPITLFAEKGVREIIKTHKK